MKYGPHDPIPCPRCEELNRPRTTLCFLCGEPLTGKGPGPARPRGGSGIPLAPIALAAALVAVFAGLWHEFRWLAVLTAVPVALALIDTFVGIERRGTSPLVHELYGDSPTVLNSLAAFAIAFGFVALVLVSAAAAFFATCGGISRLGTRQEFGTSTDCFALPLGVVAALLAAIAIKNVVARRREAWFREKSRSERGR